MNSSRELGIVSNCWKTQLDRGASLEGLIEQAVQRGFRVIELRQGSLGEFESAVIDAFLATSAQARLARLSNRFPEVRLNLAVALPWCNLDFRAADQRFLDVVGAAKGLATDGHPHLRIVHTQTRERELSDATITNAANAIATLTTQLIEAGGSLSIEHAYQPWSVFSSAIQQARQSLGSDADRLKCCFDPCNLLLTEPPESVPTIVDAVGPDEVSMIHLKQRRDGSIQPDVCPGDLDWPRLLRLLERRGHQGPWLFEVAPHELIWENLQRSAEYLFE